MLLVNLVLFIFFGVIIMFSGTYLVKSLIKIANFLKISEFTAAVIIMALATSIPEFFVGISSAISGNPSLSLGNIIGANIMNLTLITGIFVLMSNGIKFKERRISKDSFYMALILLLIVILYIIGRSLSRIDGAILILVFLFNSYRIIKKRKKTGETLNHRGGRFERKEIVLTVLIFCAALVILFVSARYIVKYGTLLAVDLQLPSIMIGLFLLALATTLPELVFGLRACKMGHPEMSIGDQIGTIIVNTTLIIGLVALIRPIKAEFIPTIIAGVFMFIAAFIFMTFVESKKKIEISEGVALIMLYIFFVIIEFFLKGV